MTLTPTHYWSAVGSRIVAVEGGDLIRVYTTDGIFIDVLASDRRLTPLWDWHEVLTDWGGHPTFVRYGDPLNESHDDSPPDAHDDSSPELLESSSPESHDDSPLTRTAREVLDRDAQDYERSRLGRKTIQARIHGITPHRESHGAYTPGGKFLPNITEGGTCK